MMLTASEEAIRNLAQVVRDHLRDGICHIRRADIEDLGRLLLNYGPSQNRLDKLNDDQLNAFLRAEIMYYSALDHLDSVTIELKQRVLFTGEYLSGNIEAEIESACREPIESKRVTLLKHKLAYLVSYGNELYRKDDLEKSCKVCDGLYRLVKALHTAGYSMHGLLARVCVQLAKAHRQLMRYEEARRYYDEALEATYLQAALRMKELAGDPEKQNKELPYYRRRAVMILAAGSGYIYIASGNFQRAAMLLWPLRTVMLLDEDSLSQTYLKMLTASVMRARAGSDESMLERARQELEEAYQFFKDAQHLRYMRPSLFELVLALIYLRRFDEAARYTEELRKPPLTVIRTTNPQRWEIIACLLDGIRYKYLGEPDKALLCAERAFGGRGKGGEMVAKKGGSQYRRSRIEVATLCGEALYRMGDYSRAEEKFKEAINLNIDESSKTSRAIPDQHLLAAANIYLALIALEKSDEESADIYYDVARSEPVEHRWVKDLEEAYKKRRDEGKTLVFNDHKRSYADFESQLQNWLIRKLVSVYGPNATRIGEALGIHRTKVKPWLDRVFGPQEKMMGRKNNKK